MSQLSSQICDHCGLRFTGRSRPEEEEPQRLHFCCAGCQAVYHALHGAGLEDFYALRQSWSGQARPVDAKTLDAEDRQFLDDPTFLEENSELLEDGTRRIDLHLEGVHCAGCIWLVERMPRHVDGAVEARLELTRQRVSLRWNPDRVGLSQMAKWLSKFGFMANPLQAENVEARRLSSNKMLIRVGICWAIAANVMLLTIALYAGLDAVSDPGLYAAILWTTLGLSTISLAVGGSVFFRRAWTTMRMARLSMDVPISLGILVGWGHSAWVIFIGHGEVWFDSITVLIAALLTARYLQIRGNSMAADAAERLVALLPRTARRVLNFGGAEESVETVAADALQVGDRVEVRSGDVVPADGCVIRGVGQVSRAVLTGESRPESVAPGTLLEAGTTNLASPIYVDVTATGEATRVGRLMAWVHSRREHRAPIVQLADRLGGYFIALVLLAALATAIAWSFIDPSRAVANVVALLVIACPCALGMATPLALTVGVGQAARRGIHVKHDDVIEALQAMTDIVFDKTGTLTEGRPSVVDVFGDRSAAARASALETRSSHPLARALLDWARDHNDHAQTLVEDVEEVPGAGIKGLVDGRPVALGRLSWIDEMAPLSPAARSWAESRAADGLTPVAVAVDGEIKSVLALGDSLRPEALDVVRGLSERGVAVHLLSGDHPQVVDAAAQRLGIDASRSLGGVTPEDKLRYIEDLQQSRPDVRVAMVGDGVNDAAALQAATVGIAVKGGAEASLVAADVFIVQSGVAPVEELLTGTRRVMGVVHRNLIGSGIYNVFGITLAAFGFISPLAAAILMPISSLGVVASSLAQRSFAEEDETLPASPQPALRELPTTTTVPEPTP